MVEDNTGKILTNRKSNQKPPNIFYATLNFNCKSASHVLVNSHVFVFKEKTDSILVLTDIFQ